MSVLGIIGGKKGKGNFVLRTIMKIQIGNMNP
jgi:hypothetical protein